MDHMRVFTITQAINEVLLREGNNAVYPRKEEKINPVDWTRQRLSVLRRKPKQSAYIYF